MGRILKKKLVGSESSKNSLCSKTVLKSQPVLSQKREALMDKTNALKRDDPCKQSHIPPKKRDETGKKQSKVTGRRQSSKENYEQVRQNRRDNVKPVPLVDNTNAVGRSRRALRGKDGTDSEVCKENARKELDDDGFKNPLERAKHPVCNAAKFTDGDSARTPKLDSESVATSPRLTKPEKVVSKSSKYTKKRHHGVNNSRKDEVTEDVDENQRLSHDSQSEEIAHKPDEERSLRKLPPRNASKYEKGWITTLLKPRKSKENDSSPKSSPAKILNQSVDLEVSTGESKKAVSVEEKCVEPVDLKSKGCVETGEEEDVDETVPNKQKARSVRQKKVLESLPSTSKAILNPSSQKSDAPLRKPKPRGLESFESRIASKLGIDMNEPSKTPKETVKDSKKPLLETSSRRLRNHGAKNVKTYREDENSAEDESDPKEQSRTASKISPKKPLVVSQDADFVGSQSKLHRSGKVESKPGCSKDSGATSLHCKSAASQSPVTKKSPIVTPSSSLFSIFKKPETHRRSSLENKIFVSGVGKPTSPEGKKKQLPIYGNPNMTPLKKSHALPQESKEELYDFEIDENEPKPKKKHKPIMKIQRVRAVKRKKPQVYQSDRETELRVLKNLDLSPSVLEEISVAKKAKLESARGVVTAHTSKSVEQDDDDHFGFDVEPMSSPCRDYGQSTPMRSDVPNVFTVQDKFDQLSAKVYSPVKSKSPATNEVPSFLDDSRDRFSCLSAKVYSPGTPKNSPIPVLMADNIPDSSKSVRNASFTSAASGNSIYHDDLDVSASTPVKFNKNNSTHVYSRPKPVELNISNCFGFDEPEIVEEPLVSPIKSTIQAPATVQKTVVPPVAVLKSKLPVMLPPPAAPAVDVDQVIQQLKSEVGECSLPNSSANVSMFDDLEISLKNKSPIKRYFQSHANDKHKAREAPDESTSDEANESLTSPVAQKMPRISYTRQSKLRKKVEELVYKETSECESAEDSDGDQEHEPEDIFKPTRNKVTAPKKKKEKGMTKKEEEELEKWAEMFNSQCNQIDQIGLVVE